MAQGLARVRHAFGDEVAGKSTISAGRFALAAAQTYEPFGGSQPEACAFVVGRETPALGGTAQIKVQRINGDGTLGWSALVPTQLGQTDANGVAVVTHEAATKVFVTGWYKNLNPLWGGPP
ncbi:MAG: hypothetical protein AB7G11_04395 [Phycisphaerales bacterium]